MPFQLIERENSGNGTQHVACVHVLWSSAAAKGVNKWCMASAMQ
jgi:hypothetical protein